MAFRPHYVRSCGGPLLRAVVVRGGGWVLPRQYGLCSLWAGDDGLPAGFRDAADEAYVAGRTVLAPGPGRNLPREKDSVAIFQSGGSDVVHMKDRCHTDSQLRCRKEGASTGRKEAVGWVTTIRAAPKHRFCTISETSV